MTKILLVAPRFHGIEKCYLNEISKYGDLTTFFYEERDYEKIFSLATKVAVRFFPKQIRTRLKWDCRRFCDDLKIRLEKKFSFVVIVKPHLLLANKTYAANIFAGSEKFIFINYDTKKRFLSSHMFESVISNFTFDVKDSYRPGYIYCPIPYKISENKSFKEADVHIISKTIYFLGSFSFFRFYRLMIISMLLNFLKVHHKFILANEQLPMRCLRLPFTHLYITNRYRNLNLKNRVSLDFPQSRQSSGSNRMVDNGILISYDFMTPTWRAIKIDNILTSIISTLTLSKKINSSLIFDLHSEEKNGKLYLFHKKMAGIFKA
jgi:hypothetical protein